MKNGSQKSFIDVSPFAAEAFGCNKRAYKHIDKLYQLNKYEFYKCAKESKYYNHYIITEGNILQTEYSRKALGILIYASDNRDLDLSQKLLQIIQKCWPRAYNYVISKNEIDIDKYGAKISSKNITDDELNAEIFIVWYLTILTGKDFIEKGENSLLEKLQKTLLFRLEHSHKDSPNRFSYKTISNDNYIEIQKLKKRLRERFGSVDFSSYMDIREIESQEIQDIQYVIDLIFDSEMLSVSSIFNDLKILPRDIDELLCLYWVTYKNKNAEKAAQFLFWTFYLKAMIKAYNQAKEHYFRNNKETMFIKLEHLEDKVKELEELNKIYKNKAETLRQEVDELKSKAEEKHLDRIRELEQENKELREQLAEERAKDKELIALREFIFNLENEDIEHGAESKDYDLSDISAVIVGGHQRWQSKMKELLPHFKFINSENFDTRMLDNIDYVFIYPGHLSHALYYKVINAVRSKDIAVGYINQSNAELALRDMYKAING